MPSDDAATPPDSSSHHHRQRREPLRRGIMNSPSGNDTSDDEIEPIRCLDRLQPPPPSPPYFPGTTHAAAPRPSPSICSLHHSTLSTPPLLGRSTRPSSDRRVP